MIQTSEITVRTGDELLTFVLENATASLAKGRLTVLAEEIRTVEAVSSPSAYFHIYSTHRHAFIT